MYFSGSFSIVDEKSSADVIASQDDHDLRGAPTSPDLRTDFFLFSHVIYQKSSSSMCTSPVFAV